MKTILALLRRFTIRTRMRGAIAVVLGLFALVAATGMVGGLQMKRLNQAFMEDSVHELEAVLAIRASRLERLECRAGRHRLPSGRELEIRDQLGRLEYGRAREQNQAGK